MPRLISLYIRHSLIGFAIAAAFVALLVLGDVAGLGGLILRSDRAVLALVVMWVHFGVIFAGVQFAWAVMALAGTDGGDGGQGRRTVAALTRIPPVDARRLR